MVDMTFSDDPKAYCSDNHDEGSESENSPNKKIKAVALLSGGLDSQIAVTYDEKTKH